MKVNMVECGICFAEYQEGELDLHRRICILRLVFRCTLCNWDYMNMEGLWNHLDQHRLSGKRKELHCEEIKAKHKFQQCTLCNDQRAYSDSHYWDHIQVVHNGFLLQCLECGEKFKSEKRNNDHVFQKCSDHTATVASDDRDANQQSHGSSAEISSPSPDVSESSCVTEGADVITETTISTLPAVSNAQPGTFNCSICGIIFPTYCRAYYHKKKKHPQQWPTCPHCRRRYPVENYQTHVLKCGRKRFSCTLCPARFRRSLLHTNHMRRVHHVEKVANGNEQSEDKKPFSCEICGRQFSTKYCLRSHKVSKHESPKRRCSRCAKLLKIEEFQTHFAECGKKLVPCKICGAKFRAVRYVTQHIRLGRCLEQAVPIEKPEKISCKYCGRLFQMRNAAGSHMRWCRENKNVLKTSKKKQAQKNVTTISPNILAENNKKSNVLQENSTSPTHDSAGILSPHVGNSLKRLYWCHTCGISFPSFSKAKYHKQVNHKLHQCPICLKNIPTELKLKVHIPICLNRKKACDRKSKTKDSLLKHMIRAHQDRAASEHMDSQDTGKQNQTANADKIDGISLACPGKPDNQTEEKDKPLLHKCPQCPMQFEQVPQLRRHLFVCEGTTVTVVALPQAENINEEKGT